MTDYAKVGAYVLYSPNVDYSEPTFVSKVTDVALTPTQMLDLTPVSVSTSGQAITITQFTTINEVVLHNRDTTNYVTIAFTSASGSASVSLRLAAKATMVLGDVKVSSAFTLTANTAACLVDAIFVGT